MQLKTGGQLGQQRLGQLVAPERSEGLVVLAAASQLFLGDRPKDAIQAQEHHAAVFGLDLDPPRDLGFLPGLLERDVVESLGGRRGERQGNRERQMACEHELSRTGCPGQQIIE